jgi:hypothetical protein
MRMQRELQIGDVIEVHEIHLEGVVARDVWLPAEIISIDSTKFGVRFLHDSTKLKKLFRSERNNQWR